MQEKFALQKPAEVTVAGGRVEKPLWTRWKRYGCRVHAGLVVFYFLSYT